MNILNKIIYLPPISFTLLVVVPILFLTFKYDTKYIIGSFIWEVTETRMDLDRTALSTLLCLKKTMTFLLWTSVKHQNCI